MALYAGNRLPFPNHNGWLMMMALCTVLITPPVLFIGQTAGWHAQVANLMVSHYLIGALLLWGLMAYARWSIAGLTVFDWCDQAQPFALRFQWKEGVDPTCPTPQRINRQQDRC